MSVDDAAADGEADTGAGVVALVMQALEHLEDPLEVARLDADAIVTYREMPVRPLAGRADVDAGRLRAAVLQRIADQVVEQLQELGPVTQQAGQFADDDLCTCLADTGIEQQDRVIHDVTDRKRFEVQVVGANAGIVQQVAHHRLQVLDRRNGPVDPVPTPVIELVPIGAAQQLDEACDAAHGRLQVVRGHVGEPLQFLVAALERSNQELQRFAYVASHDLQTPMRSIASFVQLLGSTYGDQLDDRGRDWIHRTVASVKHLQAMVRDLLDYSRIGSDHLNFESLAVRDVVDDAILLLDASIREAGAQIVVGELPRLLGDRSQLLQLFHNLIGNALKYRGTEPARIDVSAAREGADWHFAIRDNGIGIEPRHFERIFEMFQRLHDQSHYAGTGIGLAVCRRIVNGHGGRIWVESPPGGGSIFRFSLPALSTEPS